jgi:hypothetical protein
MLGGFEVVIGNVLQDDVAVYFHLVGRIFQTTGSNKDGQRKKVEQ